MSGIKFMGRDENGLAKAIRTDNEGNLGIELVKSKVSESLQVLEPRTDDWIIVNLPHSSEGVFEQMVSIKNDLDTNVWLYIEAKTPVGNFFLEIDIVMEPKSILILTPENTSYEATYQSYTVYLKTLVDLRMPFISFTLGMRPRLADGTAVAPTAGELHIGTVKRY